MPARNWTPEELAIQDVICDAISTQPRSLAAILSELGNPITPSTLYKWMHMDESLGHRYARARAAQAQVMADEITAIADTPEPGIVITEKSDGSVETKRSDMIEHRRLRIDARKWLASKLLPKTYGERLALTDPSGEGPAVFLLERIGSAGKPQQ